MENDSLFNIIVFLAPIWLPILVFVICYTTGVIAEKRHYKSIENREALFLKKPAVTISKQIIGDSVPERVWLVAGSVVIGQDHFKRLLAYFRNIVGGRIKSYETLIDRARREAILRMKQQAVGADVIVNMRLETSTIGRQRGNKMVGCVESFAYGTAVCFKKS